MCTSKLLFGSQYTGDNVQMKYVDFKKFFFLQIKASGTCILKYFQKTIISFIFLKVKMCFAMIVEII